MSVLAAVLLLGRRPAPVADLPFVHEPGRIWLKGTLNGIPARTVLDSGAGGIYATEAVAARAGGVKGEAFQASAMGGSVEAWRTSMWIGLEGFPAQVVANAIISTGKVAGDTGIDVAAGFDLLAGFSVEVDYVKGRVRLFWGYSYVPPQGALGLPIALKDRRPVVRIELRTPDGRKQRVNAMVDTGSPIGILVTRRFAKRSGMDDRYRDLPLEAHPGGLGGRTQARTVPGFKAVFGKTIFEGAAVVNMTEAGENGADSGYDVMIGDGLLKRFDLAFDYQHAKLWVKPNGK